MLPEYFEWSCPPPPQAVPHTIALGARATGCVCLVESGRQDVHVEEDHQSMIPHGPPKDIMLEAALRSMRVYACVVAL